MSGAKHRYAEFFSNAMQVVYHSDNVSMVLTDLSYSSRLPVHSPPSFSSTLTYTHHVHVTVSGLVEVCIDVDYMYQRPPNGGPSRYVDV
jgi:hypothetical protein